MRRYTDPPHTPPTATIQATILGGWEYNRVTEVFGHMGDTHRGETTGTLWQEGGIRVCRISRLMGMAREADR